MSRNRQLVAKSASRVDLRPLEETDYPALFRAGMSAKDGYRWRYRGATVDIESFVRSLYAGTAAQFMVVDRVDGHAYGLVAAYSRQDDLGHCYIAFQRSSQRRSAGQMYEGIFRFIDFLFDSSPLRKIYAEIPLYNEEVVGVGLITPFRLEGVLVDHDYHRGSYHDRRIFALYRKEWQSWAQGIRGWF